MTFKYYDKLDSQVWRKKFSRAYPMFSIRYLYTVTESNQKAFRPSLILTIFSYVKLLYIVHFIILHAAITKVWVGLKILRWILDSKPFYI